jgi:hypothetical protein
MKYLAFAFEIKNSNEGDIKYKHNYIFFYFERSVLAIYSVSVF